jgi:hypothetical protein
MSINRALITIALAAAAFTTAAGTPASARAPIPSANRINKVPPALPGRILFSHGGYRSYGYSRYGYGRRF